MNNVSTVLAVSLAAAILVLAAAPRSEAADKFFVPALGPGEQATITAKPDQRAGEFKRPEIEFIGGGGISCENLELRGTVSAPVVRAATFPSVEIRSCTYLGMPARLEAESCAVSIHGGGIGTLKSSGGECDLTVESPGCTIRLGRGPFATFGFNNNGLPDEITAQSAPLSLEGVATGAVCSAPGPEVFGSFSGYLRLGASIAGAETLFEVIL